MADSDVDARGLPKPQPSAKRAAQHAKDRGLPAGRAPARAVPFVAPKRTPPPPLPPPPPRPRLTAHSMQPLLVSEAPGFSENPFLLQLEEDDLARQQLARDGYLPRRAQPGETLPERLERILGRPIDFSRPAGEIIAQFPEDLRLAVRAAWPKRSNGHAEIPSISADTRDAATREYAKHLSEPLSNPFADAGPASHLAMLFNFVPAMMGLRTTDQVADGVDSVRFLDEAMGATFMDTLWHVPSEPGPALREPPAIVRKISHERGMAEPKSAGAAQDVQASRGLAAAPARRPAPKPVAPEVQASLARATAEMVRANRAPAEHSKLAQPRSDPEGLRTWLDAFPRASVEQVRAAEHIFGTARAEARDPVRDPIPRDVAPATLAKPARRRSGGKRKAQEPTHVRVGVSEAQEPQLGRIFGRAMMSPLPQPTTSAGDLLREEMGQLWREVVAEKHGSLSQMAERLLPELAGMSNSEANEHIRKVAYEPVRSAFVRRLFGREQLRLRLQEVTGLHMEPKGSHSPYVPAEPLEGFRQAVEAKAPDPNARARLRLEKIYTDFDHEVPVAKLLEQFRATRNPRWLELAADPRNLRLAPRLENQRVLNSPHLLQWIRYGPAPDYPTLP